jgi:hypothetical protein
VFTVSAHPKTHVSGLSHDLSRDNGVAHFLDLPFIRMLLLRRPFVAL